jgi:hypothetical protein
VEAGFGQVAYQSRRWEVRDNAALEPGVRGAFEPMTPSAMGVENGLAGYHFQVVRAKGDVA